MPDEQTTNKQREFPYVRGSTELLAHVSTHTLHKYNGLLLSNSEEAAGIIRSLLRDIIAAELRHPARAERDKWHKDEAAKREAEATKQDTDSAPTPVPPMAAPGPLDRPLPGLAWSSR